MQKAVTLEDWQLQFAGTDDLKQRAFDTFFVKPAVEREYYQAKGRRDPSESGSWSRKIPSPLTPLPEGEG